MSNRAPAREKKRLDLGQFSFVCDYENQKLYLQIFNQDTRKFDSLVEVDASGNVRVKGTVSGSQTLNNYGRG